MCPDLNPTCPQNAPPMFFGDRHMPPSGIKVIYNHRHTSEVTGKVTPKCPTAVPQWPKIIQMNLYQLRSGSQWLQRNFSHPISVKQTIDIEAFIKPSSLFHPHSSLSPLPCLLFPLPSSITPHLSSLFPSPGPAECAERLNPPPLS